MRRVNGLTNMYGSLETIVSLPARLVILFLKAYRRWISPFLMPACRFHPTCSVYAMEVIASFGLLKGGFMSIRRILKCQPFHPGGIDFPPKPSVEKTAITDPLRSRSTIAAQSWKQKND